MNVEDEEYSPFGGFGSGCDLHGEESLRECTLCGIEFCSACVPHSRLCPDCAAQAEFDDEEEEPTEEEKQILLLGDFNDDEPEEGAEEIIPIPPAKKAKTKAKPKAKAKPAPKKPKT